ncbi:MAG: hypothetical protein ACOVOZ_03385, partial [Burkholderiaceae bacterium]
MKKWFRKGLIVSAAVLMAPVWAASHAAAPAGSAGGGAAGAGSATKPAAGAAKLALQPVRSVEGITEYRLPNALQELL